ncbi:DUF3153 domain-containing protein [Marininema mesophilum]|nr:DUF3153 domain-containing protein [Marininema mesophilum]
MHVKINLDGSGTYNLKVLTNPLLVDQLNSFRQTTENEGYSVKTVEEDGQKGWIATKKVKNVAKEPPGQEWMKEFSTDGKTAGLSQYMNYLTKDQKQGPITIKNSFLNTRVSFRKNVNLKKMNISNPIAKSLIDQVKLNLRITLPFKSDRNNADSVSPDGKTLSWKLEPGKNNLIYADVKFPNPIGWLKLAGMILVGIILLVLLIFLIKRLTRKKLK